MRRKLSMLIVSLFALTLVACGQAEADAAPTYEPIVGGPADITEEVDPVVPEENPEDVVGADCCNTTAVDHSACEETSERTDVTGVLTHPDQSFEGIIVSVNSGWDAEREEIVWVQKMLDAETSFQVFEMLAHMPATQVPHPTHIESMQADTQFRIEIHYTQGGIDTIYEMWGTGTFFRFTDTVGSSNDPGFVMGGNQDLILLLEQQFSGQTHTIQAGDTLFSIARFYGVTVEEVQSANGLGDSTDIRVGEILFIPRAAH